VREPSWFCPRETEAMATYKIKVSLEYQFPSRQEENAQCVALLIFPFVESMDLGSKVWLVSLVLNGLGNWLSYLGLSFLGCVITGFSEAADSESWLSIIARTGTYLIPRDLGYIRLY
jgi:hypothetical protein